MKTARSFDRKIPVCEPLYLGKEREYAADAVQSGWIGSSGRFLKEFETKFSAYCGVKYGISTTSGTTALHLALRAIDIRPGDEVVMPDFTMAAVLFSVLYCGARPVFVDAESDTWNMDPSAVESKITPKTRAILAVHTYGHPCDMDPINQIAEKHGLKVVEDAAEAHGAEYKKRRCGSLGAIACFSFYANKIITTGEGGMVVTQDTALAERCRYFKNLCFPLTGTRAYRHEDVGFNYRMTNVQAAIGLAQFENIEAFIEKRRRHAAWYTRRLEGIRGIQCPVEKEYAKNVYWMYGVLLNPKALGISRDLFCLELQKRGVETRPFFQPLHGQKPVIDRWGTPSGAAWPASERLAADGFYLPSGSGLTEQDLNYVCEAIEDTLAA